jgi:Co/Zn/Cd efflux system component
MQTHDEVERRALRTVLAINLGQSALGTAMGIWAGSTALIAAALDNLGDTSVYAVSLYATGRGLRAKVLAARLSGWLLIVLTALLVIEVLRRFLGTEQAQGLPMIVMAGINLGLNLVCLKILRTHRRHGVHFRAASMFTSNDSIVNFGIALSGALVIWVGSNWPDLVIGLIVATMAALGGKEILDDANNSERTGKAD